MLDKFASPLAEKITPPWIKPNHLSIIRIILAIPIVILLLVGQNIFAIIIFILAVLLDIFDGVLARRRNQITKEGEWLDPLADKILIFSVLITYGLSRLPLWIIITIAILEFLLALGRPIKVRLGISARANNWGKMKMAFESIAVIGLIVDINFFRPLIISSLIGAITFAFLSFLFHLRDIFRF